MLLDLTEYLARFHSGFNVFQYLTLRAILGVLTALVIALLVGPAMIRRLSLYQIGQSVRDDGPQSHLVKPSFAATALAPVTIISRAIMTMANHTATR